MNKGKKFEHNWKASIPEDVFYYRLPDPPQSFNADSSSGIRFSWKNPFDCMLFYAGKLFCLELKSTSGTSISFELVKDAKKTSMIHFHQIDGLKKVKKYKDIISGFVFNFRNDKRGTEVTFFQSIDDFSSMVEKIDKASFNCKDLIDNNGILIDSVKLKVNYKYNVKEFIENVYNM